MLSPKKETLTSMIAFQSQILADRTGNLPRPCRNAGWLGARIFCVVIAPILAVLSLSLSNAQAVAAAQGPIAYGQVELAQAAHENGAAAVEPLVPPRGRLDWPSAWSPVKQTDPTADGQAPRAQTAADGAAGAATGAPAVDPAPAPAPDGAVPGNGQPAPIDVAPQIIPPGVEVQAVSPGASGEAPSANTVAAPPKSPAPAGPNQQLDTRQEVAPTAQPSQQTETKPDTASKAIDTKEVALPADLQRAIRPVAALESRMDALFKTVERIKDREGELVQLQPQIETLINGADEQASVLQPRLADLQSQRDKLGPAPNGDAAVPESAEIQKERTRLNALVAAADGAIKKAELQKVRGRQLIGRIQSLRQSIFTRNTFERTPSPLSLGVVGQAFESIAPGLQQADVIVSQWVNTARRQGLAVGLLLLLALCTYVATRMVANRILLSKLSQEGPEPGFFEKGLAAGLFAPLVALPAILAGTILYFGLDRLALIYLQFGSFARVGLVALIVWEVSTSLARAYLQPQRPRWRVAEVDDGVAWRLYRIIQAIAAVYAVDMILREIYPLLFVPIDARIFSAFIVSVTFAVMFYLLARTPLPKAQTLTTGLLTGVRPEFIKLPLLLLSVFIVVAGAIGYVALARYVAGQVVLTSAAMLLVVIAFVAIRAIGHHPEFLAAMSSQPKDDEAQGVLSLTVEQQRYAVKLVTFVLYCVLAILAPILLLFSFGFSWIEISSVINRALFGFEVGGVRISLLQVAIALGLFAGILLLTRTVQSGLANSVFQPGRTDQGLANSIKTGIGYVGFAVAALAGLSYAGLDITNLAIVAGALSVGIGFGLQSIVNNFVSGLILLVERPIKVGDWIKVADQQGYVRRISVRSTEIETFERASVIVPNSELIAGTVTNLTHRNAMGRLQVNVGVSYAADPEQVQAILLKAAENCELVARHPPPFVVFEDFGDSALMFSLRVYLADINRGLSTQTVLRTEIFKGLKTAGIEIPYPQRDLHLRDLDGVKDMLARAAAERMRSEMARPSTRSDEENAADIQPAAATASGTTNS
ncbi:MAG: DUF3772 domain-containing protein [Pseudomonadota bacterium]